MSALTLELGTELDNLDPEDALHIQRAVREMLQLARRKKTAIAEPATQTPYVLPSWSLGHTPFVTSPQPLGLKVGLHSHKWTDWLDEAEGPGWK